MSITTELTQTRYDYAAGRRIATRQGAGVAPHLSPALSSPQGGRVRAKHPLASAGEKHMFVADASPLPVAGYEPISSAR
ncbi:MAG: hypothetical protein L0Z70_04855 [Chloroflexi bacterium]|nr:hypothetical protein [Chloroflexota bacterium]